MKVRVGLKLRIIFILLPLIQASCISTKRTIPVDARPLAALTANALAGLPRVAAAPLVQIAANGAPSVDANSAVVR